MKKHIIIIITALLLLTSCTQQITDEEILKSAEEIQAEQATDSPTAEVTSTPEPEVTPESTEQPSITIAPRNTLSLSGLKGLYDYEVWYTDDDGTRQYYNLYDALTETDKSILLDLYNDYGITLKYDLDEYHEGRYIGDDRVENMSPGRTVEIDGENVGEISFGIEVIKDFFDYLVEKGGEEMLPMIDNAVTYIYPANSSVGRGQTTPGNGGEITMDFTSCNYDSEIIFSILLEELTDRFVTSIGLDGTEFRSYNGFGWEYGGDWLGEYNALVENNVFESNYHKMFYYYNIGGILSGNGFNQSNNDWSDYQRGLWFNDFDFWNRFYNYETVRLKTVAQIEEYTKVNPNLTLDFFYNLSCPWADKYPVDDVISEYPDISYIYDYLETHKDD